MIEPICCPICKTPFTDDFTPITNPPTTVNGVTVNLPAHVACVEAQERENADRR